MKTSNRFAVLAGVAAIAFAISSASAQTTTTGSCAFNTNLKVGQRSADVMNLQKVLNSNPATSIGNAGKETNFFGPATFAAVKKFQVANNITPVSGFVGALTRAALNNACSTGGSTSSTNVVNTNTPTTNTNNNNVVSNNSIPSVLVAGSARAKIAEFTLTGNNTITSIQLRKIGVSNNDVLTNVYLYDGNNRVGDAVGVNNDGTITWNYPQGLVQVSGSKTVSVYADVKANTSGQSVGVALTGIKKTGDNNWTAVSNSAGPILSIASVNLSTVNLSTVTSVGSSVQAGAKNVSLWRGNVNVSVANGGTGVNFTGLTLKTIGSAPQNAFTNYRLLVDGTQQGQSSSLDNNNRVSFVFSPVLLRSGAHTIEALADNQAGSGRTVQFTIESAGDAAFSDTGYNAYIQLSNSLNATCATYWTINCAQVASITTVSNGILSLQEDSSVTINRLVGGSSGAVIARFTARAYGEDSKVFSVNVTPTLTSAVTTPAGGTGLRNVALFVNNVQVGQTINTWTAGQLTFNSQNNFIVPAGTEVPVEVRADLLSSADGYTYTSGNVSATLSGTAYANGVNGANSSGNSNTFAGNSTLTRAIGGADASIYVSGAVSKNISALSQQNLGSFVFTAGQTEDLNLDKVDVAVGGTLSTATINGVNGLTLLRNLTLKNGNTVIGTPSSYALSTNSFPTGGLLVARGNSVTLNLYADVDSGINLQNVTVTPTAYFTSKVSNTPGTKTTSAITSNVTRAVLATPVLSGGQIDAGYVTGGATISNAASYTLKTTTGSTVIDELEFNVTGNINAIDSVSIGGVPGVKDGNTIKFTNNLSIEVDTAGKDVAVAVKTTCFGTGNCNSNSLSGNNAFQLSLTKVGSNQSNVSDVTANVAANTLRVVSSKPSSVAVNDTGVNYNAGAQKIGEVRVTADAAGGIVVKKLTFNTTLYAGITATNPYLTLGDSAATSSATGVTGPASITSGSDYAFNLTDESTGKIGSGLTKIFNVYATLNAAPSVSGTTNLVSTQISRDQSNAVQWTETISKADGMYGIENGVGVAGISTTNSYRLKVN